MTKVLTPAKASSEATPWNIMQYVSGSRSFQNPHDWSYNGLGCEWRLISTYIRCTVCWADPTRGEDASIPRRVSKCISCNMDPFEMIFADCTRMKRSRFMPWCIVHSPVISPVGLYKIVVTYYRTLESRTEEVYLAVLPFAYIWS